MFYWTHWVNSAGYVENRPYGTRWRGLSTTQWALVIFNIFSSLDLDHEPFFAYLSCLGYDPLSNRDEDIFQAFILQQLIFWFYYMCSCLESLSIFVSDEHTCDPVPTWSWSGCTALCSSRSDSRWWCPSGRSCGFLSASSAASQSRSGTGSPLRTGKD